MTTKKNNNLATFTPNPVLTTLADSIGSLDMSAKRASYVQFGDEIADALTDFVAMGAIEAVALPTARLSALSRIAHSKTAVETIGKVVMPGTDKTYATTKAPVSRFLADVLDMSKQQVSAYMRVLRVCVDPEAHTIKPEFNGFTFSQMDVLSSSSSPTEFAGLVDSSLPMADFKGSIARLETERATLAANQTDVPSGQPDEAKAADDVTSGQPDEAKAADDVPSGQPDEPKAADKLVSFVIGRVPQDNTCSFSPMLKTHTPTGEEIPEGERRPLLVRAANLTAALNLVTSLFDSTGVTFRLPKAAEKAIIERLPAAFDGYSVKAVMANTNGNYTYTTLYAIATSNTKGSTVEAETTAKAAKRVETARLVLVNWLTGAANLEGIPAADETSNAMEIFKKACGMVENIPFMTGQVALADLYKSGDFQKPETT